MDVVVGDAKIVSQDLAAEICPVYLNRIRKWPRILEVNPYGMSSALMFRRDDVLRVGGFDAQVGNGAEDWDLWARMTRSRLRFHPARQFFARYRMLESGHSRQASTNLSAVIQMLDFAKADDLRLRRVSDIEPPISEEKYQILRNGYVLRTFTHALFDGCNADELKNALKSLVSGALHPRYTYDQLVEGAQMSMAGKSESAAAAYGDFADVLSKGLQAVGLSEHYSQVNNWLEQLVANPQKKRSIWGRIRYRL